MSKRHLTFFAAFVIALIGICLIAGQIASAKERSRDNKALLDQRNTRGGGATVNGTVTDGSGHGWPLYARVEIDDVPVFTDPVTGQYSAPNLNPGQIYTFEVTAESGGYVLESRQVTPPGGTSTEDFALLVEQAACNAPGYAVTGGTLTDFDAGQPAGWTVINNSGGSDVTWFFDDPCGRGNNTGGSGGFAIFDSDCFGADDGIEDAEMRSPSFDFSSQSNVLLSFDTEFNWYDFSLDEKADVDVSTDGGSTWTNVLRYQGGDVDGPHHEDLDISSIAGGQSDVIVRFRQYDSDFEFWWEVDNVVIGSECTQVAGGLVVGNVFDANTNLGVNDATVSRDGSSDSTTSFETPDDPAVDDGAYVLFSSATGSQDISATANNYGTDTHTVNVVADGTVEQDFVLPSGNIETDPDVIEETVDLGSSTTVQLTLNNTGNADADFKITEANGPVAPITRQPRLRKAKYKAPLDRAPGPASARYPENFRKRNGGNAKAPASPEAWVAGADYPGGLVRGAVIQCDDNIDSIYVVSGVNGGASITDQVARYDVSTDTWTTLASIPIPNEGMRGVCYQGKLYVLGGDFSTSFAVYDIATDTWSSAADTPRPVWGPAMAVFEGKIYMAGGDEDFFFGGVSNEVNIYDIASDTWEGNGATMPEGVVTAGFAQLGNFLYVVGGWNDSSPGANSQMTQRYDMSADTWETGPAFTSGRSDFSLARTAVALYAIGGDGDGGGPFDATDLVERLDTTVWPGGAWVDTGDPLPDALTANTSGSCTEGLTGGEIWSTGGADAGLSIGGAHQYKTTGESCVSVDVPWVSENPDEGTVLAGGSVQVDVTLDASVPEINQPGDYVAQLKIAENTPTTVPPVQVTMHVPLPAGWGYLEGTINALGRCDVPAGGLEGATVLVDTAGVDWTLKTDENGHYKVAFPATDSPVVVTVSAENYVGQFVSGVVVTDGGTTTQDFSLRLDAPCADKSPTSFDVTLPAGGSSSQSLTLTNDGAGTLNFKVFETVFPLAPQVTHSKKKDRHQKHPSNAAPVGPSSIRSQTARGAASEPVATASWFFGSPVPGGIVRYAHAQCDTEPGSFYVISGVDGTFDVSDQTLRYDAGTNSWTELASFPSPQEGPAGACYQGQIYVVGGGGTDQFYIYDIGSDRWSQGANLPRPVWGAAVAAWDGKVFMIGGDDDFFFGGTSDEVNIYDIASNTWTGTGTAMPAAAVTAGYVQQGPYIYIAGGWNDDSPGANNPASQRYDTTTDTWTQGPNLNNARGDVGLAGTENALYAIAGDDDGGGPFDPSADVERLDLATWPTGSWTDLGDPIPAAVTANNGGFCTEELHVFGTIGEFWTSGGIDNNFSITGNNAFRPNDEHCFSIFSDVPWLEVTLPSSIEPLEGSVPPDSTLALNVNINTSGLTPGDYTASIVITTNDPAAPQFTIPVTLHVTASLLNDDFNDGVLSTSWTYKKTWNETGGVLTTTSEKKATAIATPIFAPGCQNCGISTSYSTSGGDDSRNSIYGWWVNNNNYLEVQLKDSADKVTVRQRSGGALVKKQSASVTLAPNVFYNITITYNGTNVVVNIDGTDVLTFVPVGTLPVGTVGFSVRGGTGSFDYIVVN
ncbi:MAG TPA: choice-of-anchor J domain-containing protein [Acidobacteriota bacterium]|nr:choice-of-anchor J domain-containing protein [Acidobacteriota bacterium]